MSLSHVVVVLVGLFPLRGAQVRPLEVVVRVGVFLTVLLHRRSVPRRRILSQRERLFAGAHLVVTDLTSGFESFVGCETLLEIHPVLGSVAELFLFTVIYKLEAMKLRLDRGIVSRYVGLLNRLNTVVSLGLPCCSLDCFRWRERLAHTCYKLHIITYCQKNA